MDESGGAKVSLAPLAKAQRARKVGTVSLTRLAQPCLCLLKSNFFTYFHPPAFSLPTYLESGGSSAAELVLTSPRGSIVHQIFFFTPLPRLLFSFFPVGT